MKPTTRRAFLERAGLGAAAMALPRWLMAAESPAGRKPNIVFLLTDDLGWGDPAVQGHPYMKTPSIDRLAREGAVFRQFYVANPVCSPSRTAFMTSHYPTRHHVHGHFATHEQNAARGMPDWLDPKATTVTALLKQAGYITAHFGKWHLGSGPGAPAPGEYGIDVHKTVNSNGPSLGEEAKEPYFRANSTDRMADEAIRFMQANKDKPFYINFWTLLPHALLKPTPEQLRVYADLKPDPDAPAFQGPYKQYLKDAPDLKSQMQVFCASVTGLDAGIGRVLKALDDLGLTDNTIVVFSSDNGPEDYHVGNARNAGVGSPGPFNGRKRSLYEGGVRTPLIVRWPGHVAAGRVDSDSVIAGVDFLPTMCKLAGASLPPDLKPDGEDVSDMLTHASRPRTTPIFWEWIFPLAGNRSYRPPQLAVRDGKWKLFMNPNGSRIELYDIPADPAEATNLAEKNPDVVQRLSAELRAWHATLPPKRPPAAAKAGNKGPAGGQPKTPRRKAGGK
ncbi:MAG TPA: sulfatase-like hydrolase/transferase [Planctomycetota bacterium]|nr:sulfatase-like hydrolase/transferase [Planctomycetota bacterium]